MSQFLPPWEELAVVRDTITAALDGHVRASLIADYIAAAESVLGFEAEDAAKPNGHAKLSLELLGFSGDRLRATRDRPVPVSPLPGLLDTEPSLHVLIGKPKSGKTTFALAIAQAWSEASEPWASARPLPGGRVLVISREQTLGQIDPLLCRIALHAGRRDSTTWEDRMTLIVRDTELPAEAKKLLTLDDTGIKALHAGLQNAIDDGDPYRLVVLDSLSRLKPPGVEENDNDGMTAWLDKLAAIASQFGVYIILIHHVGHSSDPSRNGAISGGRGASAIAAVAQVVWMLERTEDPHTRRLKVEGNSVLPTEITFEIASDTSEQHEINYFKPINPFAQYVPADLLEKGAHYSLSDLARLLTGKDSGIKPTGADLRLATDVLQAWERSWLVDASRPGAGKPMKIQLRGEP